ncbi:MAG TPA: ABC transporter permease, partial [Roseivirga sp.]
MFKIAWRNAIRHKQFSILNLLGLTVGITTSIMIALYVIDQGSFDNFHEKVDRIYRVNQPLIWGDWNEEFASTGPNVAIALRTDIPEFEEVTRVHTPGNVVVNYQDNLNGVISFTETKAFVAEENIFRIFDFQSLEGSLEDALRLPGSIVITKSTAEKYFGTESPLGQTLNVIQGKDTKAFQVTAVLENIPQNSHIQFDMLMSMSSFDHIRQRQHQWIWTTFVTYALVAPETDIQQLEAKIQSIPPKWAKSEINNVFGMTFDEYVNGKSWKLTLQPLSEVYINSPASGNRLGPSGNILYIRIFAAIGVLILILCSINFMNLSTAKSANRAKEVGIRKVLGSDRKSLIRQFIFESILYVGISTIISLMATEIFLDAFNQIANTQLSLQLILNNRNLIALIISFVFVLGIAAGSYPAFYLSSFSPIKVLKGKMSNGLKSSALRNTLVIVQFTISIALIISTFFVQKQLNYVSQKDL